MAEHNSEQKQRKRSSVSVFLRIAVLLCGAMMLCGIGYAVYLIAAGLRTAPDAEPTAVIPETTTETTVTTTTVTLYPTAAVRSTGTVALSQGLIYGNTAALIAVHEDGCVLLAERNADAVIFPASMTKIMTMLTYFKLCGTDNLQTPVTMDSDILSYAWQNSASCAGFMEFETVTVEELLYGTMLPSGADAALMLAKLASGSEAAFVAEMNAYAGEMGLSRTHFVNCTGLYDPVHYSTAQDVAIMLGYAIQNPVCAKLMSAAEYVTEPNPHHTNGLTLKSTMLSRMTGSELRERYGLPITVIGGKTGYTDEAGQCLASWAEDDSGNVYLAVVAGCKPKDPYEAITDTLTLYMMTQLPADQMQRYSDQPDETTTAETTTTTGPAQSEETTAATSAVTSAPAATVPPATSPAATSASATTATTAAPQTVTTATVTTSAAETAAKDSLPQNNEG